MFECLKKALFYTGRSDGVVTNRGHEIREISPIKGDFS